MKSVATRRFWALFGALPSAIRIGDHYRALGTLTAETITWIWIDTHAEYDRLVVPKLTLRLSGTDWEQRCFCSRPSRSVVKPSLNRLASYSGSSWIK